MKRQPLLFLPLILAATLLLTACGPKNTTLNVEMTDFKYDRDTYSVPAGANVTLNLKNSGALEHSFIVMKAGTEVAAPFSALDHAKIYFEETVPAGEAISVQFKAPSEPGNYQVVCAIPGHLEQGMQATLSVGQ